MSKIIDVAAPGPGVDPFRSTGETAVTFKRRSRFAALAENAPDIAFSSLAVTITAWLVGAPLAMVLPLAAVVVLAAALPVLAARRIAQRRDLVAATDLARPIHETKTFATVTLGVLILGSALVLLMICVGAPLIEQLRDGLGWFTERVLPSWPG